MKVEAVELNHFMLFEHLDATFSPNINIILGKNNTGKTALIKLLYSCMKGYANAHNSRGDISKEKLKNCLVDKMQGVFRPDNYAIGRLVNRRQGSNRAEIHLHFSNGHDLEFAFSNRQEKNIELMGEILEIGKANPIYIPPKEIISSTENFGALYDQYQIAFEETYYDLARLLERPLRKGANTAEQNQIMSNFEGIVQGNIIQRDRKFYLKVKGQGEFEMGLVSEGYRKLSTIMYLILSGSLSGDAILFWDEPETNINPKMIKPIVDAITELAKMGVQVFVTTHDYFVQQCFDMAARYQPKGKSNLRYNFISLFEDGSKIRYENAFCLDDLTHNAVMEEFDDLYNREQGLIYDNRGK